MKTIKMLFVLGVFSILANTQSRATPLDLVALADENEFVAGPINVTYNSATSNLLAVGQNYFYGYDDDLLTYNDNSTFTLDATIDHAGVLKAGTLTITGDLGDGLETLLTGDLVPGPSGIAFGFVDPPITDKGGGNGFTFMFTISGGETTILTNDFSGQRYGGIDLDANFDGQDVDSPFYGTWTGDFDNNGGSDNGAGGALTFLIPEPSSILLMSTGGVLFAAAWRRRSKAATRKTSSPKAQSQV